MRLFMEVQEVLVPVKRQFSRYAFRRTNHRLIDWKKKLCGFAQLRKGVGIDGGSQGINGFLSRQDVQNFLRCQFFKHHLTTNIRHQVITHTNNNSFT
ncbi:TPA: hypothetical protein ACQJXC_001093 [Raoultella ornithinolytica]